MRNCLLRGWLILFSAFTFVGFASAQVPLNTTISQNESTEPAALTTPTRANAIDLNSQSHSWRSISVKAGDSINISAWAYAPRPKTFWKSLAKAVIPTIALNQLTTQPKSASGEQRSNAVVFGAGATVVPGAIVLGNRHQVKPFMKLRLYDSNSRLLSSQIFTATKASRKEWEKLTINLKIEQDGFVNLLADKGSGDLVINSIDQ